MNFVRHKLFNASLLLNTCMQLTTDAVESNTRKQSQHVNYSFIVVSQLLKEQKRLCL